MSENSPQFAIDDTCGIAENLAAYAQALESSDKSLGAALGLYLVSLSAGQQVDAPAIWDVLYAATIRAHSDPDFQGDGAGSKIKAS